MNREIWSSSQCVGTYPKDLLPKDIDAKIRKYIIDINNSNWVWTAFCCAGHASKKERAKTYIALMTRATHLPLLLDYIYKSAFLRFSIVNTDHLCPVGWSKFYLYFDINFFDKDSEKDTLQQARASIRELSKKISKKGS